MEINNFIKRIKSHLSEAELEKAIISIKEILEIYGDVKYDDKLIVLESWLKRNEKSALLDLGQPSEIRKEWNKITYSLTKLVEEIEKDLRISVKRDSLQSLFNQATENNATQKNIYSDEWEKLRDSLYANSNGVQIVHILWPTKKRNQGFDIYIYLKGHKSSTLDSIDYAEFFFGKMWHNRIFRAENKNNQIGVYTSAYGPFLCLCKLKFLNGDEIFLNRYIDFEQGELVKGEFVG